MFKRCLNLMTRVYNVQSYTLLSWVFFKWPLNLVKSLGCSKNYEIDICSDSFVKKWTCPLPLPTPKSIIFYVIWYSLINCNANFMVGNGCGHSYLFGKKNYTVRILFCLDLTKTNVKCIVYMSQSPFEHQISELFIDS